jgi:hypothetical protein
VYDKSKGAVASPGVVPCENVGREAETLLRHIIGRYDSLPAVTGFLQGDPRGNPVSRTYDDVAVEVNAAAEMAAAQDERAAPLATGVQRPRAGDHWNRKTLPLLRELFGPDADDALWFATGAQYLLPRGAIRCRPLSFYVALRDRVIRFGDTPMHEAPDLSCGIDAWTLEAMWGAIFDPNRTLRAGALTDT